MHCAALRVLDELIMRRRQW